MNPLKKKREEQARRRGPAGGSPGTLLADPDAQPSELYVIAYGPEQLEEHPLVDLGELPRLAGEHPVVWVNVNGLGSVDKITALGEAFGLHSLALEDAVHAPQRPKAEPYGDQLLIIARLIRESLPLRTEQLSVFVGAGFVVTFQETPGEFFQLVRERLRAGRPRLRQGSSDYLAYALLDAVVDAYFPVLEHYGEHLEELEEEILDKPDPSVVARLHRAKRDLLNLRRYSWPLRDLLSELSRDEIGFFDDQIALYLRDCHDHSMQVLELVESYRDISMGLMDLYLSSVSNRMNEVMKVLTIIATVFIPLGFIAGLYGMNFDTTSPYNMPELHWIFGYPFALFTMFAVALTMLVFFRRKGWLGGRGRKKEPPSEA